ESRKYSRTACWIFLDDWPYRRESNDEPLTASAIILCNGSPRHLDRLRSGQVAALITYDQQQAVEFALLAALDVARQPDHHVKMRDVPVEIVTAQSAQSYARRWVLWERGDPSPPNASDR